MPERIREVRVFEHVMLCDTPLCQGSMLPTGQPGLVPSHLMYKCPLCGGSKSSEQRLPRMISIPVNEGIPAEFQKQMDEINGVAPKIQTTIN